MNDEQELREENTEEAAKPREAEPSAPASEAEAESTQGEVLEGLPIEATTETALDAPIEQPAVQPVELPMEQASCDSLKADARAANPYEAEVFQPRRAAFEVMPQQQVQIPQPQYQMPQAQIQAPQQQYQIPQLQAQIPQRASSGGKGGTVAIIVAFVIILVLLAGVTVFYMFQGTDIELPSFGNKPSVSETDNGGGDSPIIQLPTQAKPPVEDKYMENDGRYTPQGIAKVVSPAVVGIITYEQGQTLISFTEGTGFIISSDGYILTCAHTFEGAAKQKVILDDNTEYVAEMVGKDVKSDLAVLKIDTKGRELQTVTLGDSSELELGESVIAIGNAGGFSNSISGGMVSGLDRMIRTSEETIEMNCIQTDAAVNPGNSGGPLVNMYGQVVGVVSSKYTPSIYYENIGFAITINEALPIASDIISKGYVTGRVRVGIIYQPLTDVSAKMLEVEPGLYVVEIDPTCDVANTALQIDDIITQINGVKVYDAVTVKEALVGLKPGDSVTAHVYRKDIVGEVTEFDITFRLMEENTSLR